MSLSKKGNVNNKRGFIFSFLLFFIVIFVSFMFVGCANTTKVEDVEGKGDLITSDNGDQQFEKKGGKATSEWMKINGIWYYFGADSNMVKNSVIDDMYYVGEDGAMKYNYWYKDPVTNDYYYFGSDGAKLKSTWVKDKEDWYYVDEKGVMAKDKWIESNYYVDSTGKMLKNTITPDGYVVDAEGKFFDVKAFQAAQAAAIEKAKAAKVKKVVKTTPFNNKKPYVGQTIKMGNWQSSPLYWNVIDVQPGKALILCQNIVDFIQYNTTFSSTTWASSTLRYWLNSTFYSGAFNDGSSVYIIPSAVINPANPRTETKGGASTQDRVFLLSLEEITSKYSQIVGAQLYAKPTSYANSIAASTIINWATRTPGTTLSEIVVVNSDGSINYNGLAVDLKHGVRPVMWVQY